MISEVASRWATEPFRVGTDDDFRRMREWLTSARYTEGGLLEAMGTRTSYEILPPASRDILKEIVDEQTLALHLFMDGAAVPWTTIDSILSRDGRVALDALGLLQPAMTDPSCAVSPVALHPLEGLYIVSDRLNGLEWTGDGTPADVVFAAITPETHRFLDLMPRIHCEDYLELCSGTGAAALIAASRFATRATAVDITERSTRFADFNARLNGLHNLTALQGDLFEAVSGQMFDLIVAHPPYVPALRNEVVFRDGGEDGEQITRRIIAGLAEHLRPGGQFYCECMMTDRKDARIEQRLRQMLGESEGQFDIIIAQVSSHDPVTQFGPWIAKKRTTPEGFALMMDLFNRLEIEAFTTVNFLIHRRATERTVATKRKMMTGATTAEAMQWLLHTQIQSLETPDPEAHATLSQSPRLAPATEWRTRLVFQGGEWRSVAGQLFTGNPFLAEADCPPWTPALLGWCDGKTPGHELLRRLQGGGVMTEPDAERRFATILRRFAEAAFIELPDLPLPDGVLAPAETAAG